MSFTKNYKYFVTHNFPIVIKKPQYNSSKIISCGLLSPDQTQYQRNYEMHISNNTSNQILLFDNRGIMRRQFNYILKHQESDKILSNTPKEKQPSKIKLHNTAKNINQLFLSVLQTKNNNLFVMPTLEVDQTNSIILGSPDFSKKGLLSIAIDYFLPGKGDQDGFLLSIIAINNDSLSDQLNFQWIQSDFPTPRQNLIQEALNPPNDPIHNILKKQPRLKVHKDHQNIFVEALNRHKLDNQENYKELITHYRTVKQYLYRSTLKKPTGYIYQLSFVKIDQQDNIWKTYNKLYVLQINKSLQETNQYPKNSMYTFKNNNPELLQMKIGSILNYLTTKQEINSAKLLSLVRDNKVLMALSKCFEEKEDYQIILINQIGRTCSIRQEILNLSIDLQCQGRIYQHQKNYLDNKQLMKVVKSQAMEFIPLGINQRKYLIRQNWKNRSRSYASYNSSKSNKCDNILWAGNSKEKIQKQIKKLQNSQVIRNKSFFHQTYSSYQKKHRININHTSTQKNIQGPSGFGTQNQLKFVELYCKKLPFKKKIIY